MLKRIVKMQFREDRAQEFIRIFEANAGQIRSAPGCRHLELLRDLELPATFFTISIWDNAEALEQYRQSNLFKQTWAATKSLFAGKARAWSTESHTVLP